MKSSCWAKRGCVTEYAGRLGVFQTSRCIARSVITLCCLFAVSFPSPVVLAGSPAARLPLQNQMLTDRGTRIRVMSYNIGHGVGIDGVYDIHRIANVIQSSRADIVGLQEVDVRFGEGSHYDNQVEILARELHMYAYYAPIYNFDPLSGGAHRRRSGLLVLSKFPIVSATNHRLARLPNQKPYPIPEIFPPTMKSMPGFADVVVHINGRNVRVYDTHLDYRSDKRVRIVQVQQMMQVIPEREQSQILLGDFNASPWEPELEPITQRLNDTLLSCKGQCYSYPSNKPKSLVDYVFVSPHIHVEKSEVLTASASDHCPVVATLIV